MMESLKNTLNKVPISVWIILALFIALLGFWFSDDIGSLIEKRRQARFDKIIAEKQVVIDELTEQRNQAIIKAEEAEAREQSKIIEVDLLRQEVAKKGVNIQEAQKDIDNALQEYKKDLDFIEQVKNGEVSQFDFCIKQCADSALVGYKCRVNYCDKFK